MGFRQLRDVRKLSERQVQDLTKDDQTFEEYKRFRTSLRNLKSYGDDLENLETELLSHHKSGYIPPHAYSLLTLLLMGE